MDSRTYWRKREELFAKQDIRTDKALAKEVDEVLKGMSNDIQDEIDAFYTRYASREGISMSEVNKRVAKMDVEKFASKAKKYVENKDFSDRANAELKIYNLKMKASRLELLKAQVDLQLISGFSDIDSIMRKSALQQGVEEYRRDAGIMADSVSFDVEKRVTQVLRGSYKLKDTPTFDTFSDNIWLYKTELQNDLEKMLVRTFTRGENPRVMARELRDRFNVTGYQAERLARTETAKLQTGIQRDNLETAGIEQYEYIAEPTACKLCSSNDGKILNLKDLVVGKNASPMHPNCRCRISPYMSSNDMYKDWLDRDIISKDEYESATAFKRDYDTKFEKLMKKRNKHDQSDTGIKPDYGIIKPKATSPKPKTTSDKFKDVLKDVDFSKPRGRNARKVLDNLGLDEIPVHVKNIGPNGYCEFGTAKDGTVNMVEYALDSGDQRSKDYQNKTLFHEAYHAMNNGRKSDWKTGIFGDIDWLDIEETFAETSAHYAMKQAGINTKIAPAYSQQLVDVLPRLKKLDKFKNAKTLSDFGEIAWSDRLAGQGSTWENLAKEASAVDHDWVSYSKQYSKYIKENDKKLIDKMIENMPSNDTEYIKNLMNNDLHNASDKAESGLMLTRDERMVYSNVLIIAMDIIGVK